MRRFGQLATRLCRSHGTVRPSVIRGPSGNPAQAHPIFSRGCIRHLSNDSNVLGEPLETEVSSEITIYDLKEMMELAFLKSVDTWG
jgi:hypothetical protein